MTPTEKLVERLRQNADGFESAAEHVDAYTSEMHACHAVLLREAADALEAKDAALSRSILAIDDWLSTFAPEECSEDRVKEARTRIHEVGGTLAYIAEVQEQNRKAGAR